MPSVTETEIPGGWTQRTLKILDREFDLVLPSNPDQFLESLSELPVVEHDKHDVYWAMLWQAAPLMAARVLAVDWPNGEEALEFGCGIGLVGLAALARGMNVTFSDYEPMAIKTALENAHRNGFAQARAELVDWRDPPAKQYRYLFGCDVLYNQHMHENLIGFIERTLTPDGVCWIGDAGRFHAEKFLALAKSRGFDVRLEDELGNKLQQVHHGKFQMFLLRRDLSCGDRRPRLS